MGKLSKSSMAECEPYLNGLKEFGRLEEILGKLVLKRTSLEREVTVVSEKLHTLENERPRLLRSVLDGAAPESQLNDSQSMASRLRTELEGKRELLGLVVADIEKQNQSRVDLNANIGALRRQTMATIEADLLAENPGEWIDKLLDLSAVAGVNSRTLPMLLFDLLGEHSMQWWESRRVEVLSGYGLPS